jgi:hypothetical protein
MSSEGAGSCSSAAFDGLRRVRAPGSDDEISDA